MKVIAQSGKNGNHAARGGAENCWLKQGAGRYKPVWLTALGACCLTASISCSRAQTSAAGSSDAPLVSIGGSGSNAVNPKNVINVPAATSAPLTTGLLPSLGNTLLENGIDIHGIVFDHFLYYDAGSIPNNTTNFGFVQPVVDVDLDKLAHLPGASLHGSIIQFLARSNDPDAVAQTGGTIDGFQTGPFVSLKALSLLTYEQTFLRGNLDFEIGRTNIYRYFLIPNGFDPLTQLSLTVLIDADTPSPVYSNWGGHVAYHVSPTWSVQTGAFEDNVEDTVAYGFPFGTRGAAGVQILGALDYRSEFENAAFPANMEAGFEYDTRHGIWNLKGVGEPYAASVNGPIYAGGGVAFFQGQQVLWRGHDSPGARPPNIALYGSFDFSVDKPQPIDCDAVAGISYTGFIPGRDGDVLNLQVHYQRLSQIEADHESMVHTMFYGPGPSQPRNQYAFEALTSLAVTRWFSVEPFVQYLVNPDTYASPSSPRARDGVLTGLYGIVSIGPLLGTSNKPF